MMGVSISAAEYSHRKIGIYRLRVAWNTKKDANKSKCEPYTYGFSRENIGLGILVGLIFYDLSEDKFGR